MKCIFTSFLLVLCANVFSQAGSFDKSFGVNGMFSTSENLPSDAPYGIQVMVIQPDGKIVLAGYGNTYLPSGMDEFSILRINANGTIDNSFGNAGRVFLDLSNATEGAHLTDNRINSIAIQPDGKIVVAGTVKSIPSPPNYPLNYSDIGVVRLNSNGSLDTTFNATGKKRIDLSSITGGSSSYDVCNGVAIRANGKIVLAGNTVNNINESSNTINNNNDALLIQLNTDGSFDSSFTGDGIQIFEHPESIDLVTGMALQTDGSVFFRRNYKNRK